MGEAAVLIFHVSNGGRNTSQTATSYEGPLHTGRASWVEKWAIVFRAKNCCELSLDKVRKNESFPCEGVSSNMVDGGGGLPGIEFFVVALPPDKDLRLVSAAVSATQNLLHSVQRVSGRWRYLEKLLAVEMSF